jgi:endonuclease G, mitochondrial
MKRWVDTWSGYIRNLLLLAVLAGLLSGWLSGCTTIPLPITGTGPVVSGNPHLRLGNPSQANSRDSRNYLIERPQYVLSYNRSRNQANWASWQLSADWLGSLPRSNFSADMTLPSGWQGVTPSDYTGSGFDRGHLVPAADRNRTPADSAAVFLMTNIFPQAPDNNRGPWEKLERYCRELVGKGRELYIIAGTVGDGGVGRHGERSQIGRGAIKIAVPAQTWKVVVVGQPGQVDYTRKTRVIAVLMPNRQGIEAQDWREFRTSVREIEALTGYDLLSALPAEVQAELEVNVDGRP